MQSQVVRRTPRSFSLAATYIAPKQPQESISLVLVQGSLERSIAGNRLLGRLDVTKTLLCVGLGVWVEAEQHLLVAEWVLLLDNGALGNSTTLDWAEHGLDLGAVDELGDVWLRDNVLGKEEVLLERRGLGGGAVDGVKGGEGGRSPDAEASKVATWCELEKVQGVDWAGLDTWNVAESADELLSILLWLVDDERATALLVAAVPQLTLASAELARVLDLLNLGGGTDGVEEVDGLGGLLQGTVGEGGAGDDEGNLRDGTDAVATGEDKGSAGRSSDGRNGGETPGQMLVFPVPQVFEIAVLRTSGQG